MLHFGSIKTKLSLLQTWRCLALFAFLNFYIYLKSRNIESWKTKFSNRKRKPWSCLDFELYFRKKLLKTLLAGTFNILVPKAIHMVNAL